METLLEGTAKDIIASFPGTNAELARAEKLDGAVSAVLSVVDSDIKMSVTDVAAAGSK